MFTLVFNLGSSSIKFKIFDENLKEIFAGQVEKIGQKDPLFTFSGYRDGFILEDYNHEDSLSFILHVIDEKVGLKNIVKIGHRVVHGGDEFTKPTLIDKNVLKHLTKYNKLAPLHNPYNLLGIKFCLKKISWAKNYAVFDTAFYKTLPDYAYRYALPNKIFKKFGYRKYGFHGISHEYVADQVAKKLKKPLSKLNLITCHLGSGCSITAIKHGKAIDTSMGFTPLEGVMMLTRAGDLDPAVPLKLIENGMSVLEVYKMLNFESGILGLTGYKDLRDVLTVAGYKIKNYKFKKKRSKEQFTQAKLAIQMFIYRVKKYIGAYFAVLGKVDCIVFTAGIGERSEIIRNLIMKDLPFKTKVLVVPTNEELQIARKIN